jgi:hypothetical protein
MNNFVIRWCIERPDGNLYQGRVALDEEHVARMYVPRPPVDFAPYGAEMDYRRSVEKADALARMIASQIAADIVEACNPARKP